MIDKNRENNPAKSMNSLEEMIAQEENYQFDAFSAGDAIRLANCMLENEKAWGKTVGFSIFLNGYTVYQYLPEGCGRLNARWLEKKINMVMNLGWSTMRLWTWMESEGQQRNPEIFPDAEITPCGGGFPITVKGCGVVGAIAVTALGDQSEHDFIIDSLEKFTA